MNMDLIIEPELERCLPPLDEGKYQWIKERMIANGYETGYPVIVWKGKNIIVDGHHRYKACLELGIDPTIDEVSFDSIDDALLYAYEHQENRRNLLPSQTAIVGTKRMLLKERIAARNRQFSGGSIPAGIEVGGTSTAIAKELKVGKGTIDRIITVIDANEPELEQMLVRGEIKAETGDLFIKNTGLDERKEIIKNGPGAVKKIAANARKVILEEKKDAKFQDDRAEIEKELDEYREVQKEKFGGSTYCCGLSSVFELWCIDCYCAFDVFKPHEAKFCPACGGPNTKTRDESWYPGKKVN